MSRTVRIVTPAFRQPRPVVIALHCSGRSRRQWRQLSETLGSGFEVIAPDFYGSGSKGHWTGERPFSLKEEAVQVVDIIDECDGPVHIVGHSYGGGVALRVAIERPARIASLSLYEPTAFHILKSMGSDGRAKLAEIRAVAADIKRAVVNDNYQAGARRFVDYWNGVGTWNRMRPETQAEQLRYVPKACLDFHALIEEPTTLAAYRRIRTSLLLLLGEHAPEPTQAIVRKLTAIMKPAGVTTIADAGHMGPFSHPVVVANAIAAHIVANEPRSAISAAEPVLMRNAA